MGYQQGIRAVVAIAASVILAACGDPSTDAGPEAAREPVITAATLGEQTVRAVSEYLAEEPYTNADPANGERQAQVCRACHSLDRDGNNMIGPALYGFFGAPAGVREGFEYSPVLRNADFVWTPEALDAWLAYPGRFLPGNRMTFAGVTRAPDRRDLIAYLMRATTSGAGT